MTDTSSTLSTPSIASAGTPSQQRLAVCPLCHTPSALTMAALAAGQEWRCGRCSQHWDGASLAGAAAYAAWTARARGELVSH